MRIANDTYHVCTYVCTYVHTYAHMYSKGINQLQQIEIYDSMEHISGAVAKIPFNCKNIHFTLTYM